MHSGDAQNRATHWQGAADFLVEVISPDDRTREKLPYFASLGVRELLLIDRDPWAVELYRLGDGGFGRVGVSRLDDEQVLRSEQVPLSFRLVACSASFFRSAYMRSVMDVQVPSAVSKYS